MIRNKIIVVAFVLCLTLSIFINTIDNAEAGSIPSFYFDEGENFEFEVLNGSGRYESNNTLFINSLESYNFLYIYSDFGEVYNTTEYYINYSILKDGIIYNSYNYNINLGEIVANEEISMKLVLYLNCAPFISGEYNINLQFEFTDENKTNLNTPTKAVKNIIELDNVILLADYIAVFVEFSTSLDYFYVSNEIGIANNPNPSWSKLQVTNIGTVPITKITTYIDNFITDEYGSLTTYSSLNMDEWIDYSNEGLSQPFTYYTPTKNTVVHTFLNTNFVTGDMREISIRCYDLENYLGVGDYFYNDIDLFIQGYIGVVQYFTSSIDHDLKVTMFNDQYLFTLSYTQSKTSLEFPNVHVGATNFATTNLAFVNEVTGNGWDIDLVHIVITEDFTPVEEPTGFKISNNGKLAITFDTGTTWIYRDIQNLGEVMHIEAPTGTVQFYFGFIIDIVTPNAEAITQNIQFTMQLETNPIFIIGGGIRPPPTPPNPTIGIGMRILLGDENGIYGDVNDYLNEFNQPTSPFNFPPNEPAIEDFGEFETTNNNEVREHKLYFLITTYLVRWQYNNNNFEVQDYYLDTLTTNNYFDAVDWVRPQSDIGANYLVQFWIQGIRIVTWDIYGDASEFTLGVTSSLPEQDLEYYYSVQYREENSIITYCAFPPSVPHDTKMMDGSFSTFTYTTLYIPPIIEPTGTSIDDYLYDIYTPEGRNSFWTFSIMMSLIIVVLLFTKRKNGKIFVR